jgi:hypothetical protein
MRNKGEIKLNIRGVTYLGNLYNLTIELLGFEGCNLKVPTTVFMPNLEPYQKWNLPSIMGYQGCLDRLRFAIDPETSRFYFGRLGMDKLE